MTPCQTLHFGAQHGLKMAAIVGRLACIFQDNSLLFIGTHTLTDCNIHWSEESQASEQPQPFCLPNDCHRNVCSILVEGAPAHCWAWRTVPHWRATPVEDAMPAVTPDTRSSAPVSGSPTAPRMPRLTPQSCCSFSSLFTQAHNVAECPVTCSNTHKLSCKQILKSCLGMKACSNHKPVLQGFTEKS